MNFSNYFTVADPDFQRRGAGGGGGSHLDPQIRGGGGGLQKKYFRPFRPQFGLKIKGEGERGPRAPPLDPPLLYQYTIHKIYFSLL